MCSFITFFGGGGAVFCHPFVFHFHLSHSGLTRSCFSFWKKRCVRTRLPLNVEEVWNVWYLSSLIFVSLQQQQKVWDGGLMLVDVGNNRLARGGWWGISQSSGCSDVHKHRLRGNIMFWHAWALLTAQMLLWRKPVTGRLSVSPERRCWSGRKMVSILHPWSWFCQNLWSAVNLWLFPGLKE